MLVGGAAGTEAARLDGGGRQTSEGSRAELAAGHQEASTTRPRALGFLVPRPSLPPSSTSFPPGYLRGTIRPCPWHGPCSMEDARGSEQKSGVKGKAGHPSGS